MIDAVKIFGVLLAIIGSISCRSNYTGIVKIEHVGSCDKYVTNLIFVKTDTITDIETEEFVKISEKSFDCLTDYLIKNKKNTEFDKYVNKYGDYGTFRVCILTKDGLRDTFNIRERRNSFIFFSKLKKYLTDNKIDSKVTDAIQNRIIKRMEYPAPGFPEK